MRIGVVIPVWRRARLVCECLEHVAAQSRPADEIVVVDDESGDGTPAAVQSWAAARPDVPLRLLQVAHAGAATARNVGLRALPDATHVAFLDSDDLWPPDFLARAATAFEAGVVAASADRSRDDARRAVLRKDDLRGLARNPFRWFFRNGAGVGSCTLLDVQAVRHAGGYREEIATGEDMALFLAVAEQGRWVHLPGAPVRFRLGHRAQYGEADHVHRLRADAPLRRAALYEELAERYALHLPEQERRRALAWKWWRVALALKAHGNSREARAALRRARGHRPCAPRLLWASLTWPRAGDES